MIGSKSPSPKVFLFWQQWLFWTSVLIAVIGIVFAFIAWGPFRRKERWARNAIIAAFTIWVLLDSAICIRFGVYFQIYVINLISLVLKGLPLVFTWKEFKG